MEGNILFIGIVTAVALVTLCYGLYRTGSYNQMVGILKKNKALADWKPFVGIAVGLLVLFTIVQQSRA